VVPVIALVEGVIHAVNAKNPELVTKDCLSICPESWNGRPVVFGHPMRDGAQVSANAPSVLEEKSFGTIFNSRLKGPRLLMDAWIDPAKAERVGAGIMLGRIVAGDVVEVSVGAFVVLSNTVGLHNGKRFNGKWTSVMPDHLAFLATGVGACSVAMGCGTRAAEGPIPDGYALALAKRKAVPTLDRANYESSNGDFTESNDSELMRSMTDFRNGWYESAAANLVGSHQTESRRVDLSPPDPYQLALDRIKETR
jgi:hypothetical protein